MLMFCNKLRFNIMLIAKAGCVHGHSANSYAQCKYVCKYVCKYMLGLGNDLKIRSTARFPPNTILATF